MIIIRPLAKKDQDIFVEFSFNATLGIRNLPRNRDKLHDKIIFSEQSFAKHVEKPGKEEYFFVLEDLSTGRIGGTCGIFTSIDPKNSSNFRIETRAIEGTHPSIIRTIKILKPARFHSDASEICSLYLQPTFRHSGQGRLLSLSRFLFIASHRERFKNKILAELRGYIDPRQISPFWEAVGHHFCDLSFVELMAQVDQGAINIKEIIPRYPIYISLLSPDVQNMIGKPHEASKPALDMLLHEGFKTTNEVDTLEAGPAVIAKTSNIRSIKQSRVITIDISETLNDENEFIIANTKLDFRACYGDIQFKNEKSGFIHPEVADALQVKKGDLVRFVTLH
jgi:arginine N-succinyltransferase